MAKKGTDYFEMFTAGVSYSCDAAALLSQCFAQYDPQTLRERMEQMHEIEHTADGVKHTMMHCLVKEFLPPLEREDIMELCNRIDDVTDCIEDVLLRLYMFNITSLRPDAAAFADVITKCCSALESMTRELSNFKKSTSLREKVIEINHLEEEGDRLYTQAMRRLYTEETDAITIGAWTELYNRLEKCCDSCESVADVVERVVLKNC
jgi:hypothetical protein